MTTLRDWHRRGAGSLITRLAALGAAAGVAAWILTLAVYRFFDVSRPGLAALEQAIVRGTIVGALVGVILHLAWRRGHEGHP